MEETRCGVRQTICAATAAHLTSPSIERLTTALLTSLLASFCFFLVHRRSSGRDYYYDDDRDRRYHHDDDDDYRHNRSYDRGDDDDYYYRERRGRDREFGRSSRNRSPSFGSRGSGGHRGYGDVDAARSSSRRDRDRTMGDPRSG